MLSYLASALPFVAGAEARLLAIQCALRTDALGRTWLPSGLLRSLRLAHEPALWQELEEIRWLRRSPISTAKPRHPGVAVHLLDVGLLTQAPGRAGRNQAADWAARVASRLPVRRLLATERLATLALTAHLGTGTTLGILGADCVRRACGMNLQDLLCTLDRLATAGVVKEWAFDPATEDLHWELDTDAFTTTTGAGRGPRIVQDRFRDAQCDEKP
ncbi:hypothetical protein [Streptomyces sp. NPDC055287]